jgi:hypothetical protein
MTLTEDNIADYADTLVLQARARRMELDYSASSVARLEELVAVSDELLRLEPFPETQRNLIIFYTGCYLGETLARSFGGVWSFAENWYESTLVFTVQAGGIQIRPFQKIHDRVTSGPADHDLGDYLQNLKARLDRP